MTNAQHSYVAQLEFLAKQHMVFSSTVDVSLHVSHSVTSWHFRAPLCSVCHCCASPFYLCFQILFTVMILEIHNTKIDIRVYAPFWGFLVIETPNYAKAFWCQTLLLLSIILCVLLMSRGLFVQGTEALVLCQLETQYTFWLLGMCPLEQ